MVRLKHRFIIAQIVLAPNAKFQGKVSFAARDIQAALRTKINELYGDVGLGEFGQATYVRYHEGKYSNIFVVKTHRDAQVKVHFAMSCISELGGVPLCLRSLSVNSCPRTCLQSLKQLFTLYFQNCDIAVDNERMAAEETIGRNLDALEL